MKKMSLANIEGKLSRAEMRSIMAGSGYNCKTTSCTLYAGGYTYQGHCGGVYGYNSAECYCMTDYGPYIPFSNGGMSHC